MSVEVDLLELTERQFIENFLFIVNKKSNKVRFRLNEAQDFVDRNLSYRTLIPKDRQRGVTSYILAKMLAKCILHENQTCVVIAHKKEASKKMLKKVKYYLANMSIPQPKITRDNANEIHFEETNSTIYIGSAQDDDFGRGDTIHFLHCSEVAFWPNAEEQTKGLFQSVPRDGIIVLESTGNGLDFFSRRVKRAQRKEGRYKVIWFGGWITSPEYTVKLTKREQEKVLSNLNHETEEDILVRDFGLTAGQIQFRREKLEEFEEDVSYFKQEYPLTIDECFQTKGDSYFHKVNYKPNNNWVMSHYDPKFFWIKRFSEYARTGVENYTYVMGADVGGGVKKDYSVLQIICVEEMRQVGTYRSNTVAPDKFAEIIYDIGKLYGFPFVVVEANNHGLTTLSYLNNPPEDKKDKKYPRHMIYKSKEDSSNIVHLGKRTTATSKPLLCGNLRRVLADGMVLHSELTVSECSTFIEHENGKLEAKKGYHDDEVMSLAMANSGISDAIKKKENKKKVIFSKRKTDPFSLEGIINEMRSKKRRFPVKPQNMSA